MTNEEAIKIFNTVLLFGKCDLPKEETEECLKMAIEALKKEPEELCDDCISRMSIIQKLSARFVTFVDNVYGGYEKCDKSIRNEISEILADIVLEPPVKPKSETVISQPKTGYWKWVTYDSARPEIGNWHCSECNEIVSSGLIPHPLYKYHYCPNCGAKMEVDTDEILEKILKKSLGH